MKLRTVVHVTSDDGRPVSFDDRGECSGLSTGGDGTLLLVDDDGVIEAEYEPGSWDRFTVEVVE